MSLLNVNEWTVQQVTEWIAGLDPTICMYGPEFTRKQINGAKLLNLMAGDLVRIGINKVGDQLLLHDAIQSLRNEMETDRITMQTLASNLSVRCKTYRSELSDHPKKNKIPTQALSTAAYLLDASKTLVRWLTRYPFLGVIEYDEITKKLTKHCFEIALISQRDSFADNASEEVQYLCTKIIEICDYLIHTNDSLAYQAAAIDIINIRKRHEQEWGLQFETSYFGLHLISGVVLNSPAQQSGGTPHLERGDEILQVNYQTVVGWIQPNVISLLLENQTEAILTIKRRPRHASNMLGHMYLKPNRVPVRKVVSPVAEEQFAEKDLLEKEKKVQTVGNMQDLSNQEPSSTSNAESRFWKLYPNRPRGLLRRRATISGTSPISTRPPVTFIQDDTYAHKRRPPLDKSKSESNKLDMDDQALKLFVGETNVKGSRVTLPLMENLNLSPFDTPAPESISPVANNTANSPKSLPVETEENQTHLISTSEALVTGAPVYTGYLHERAQWKFGPRWNRHKAALYPKLLAVGSQSFKISENDYRVAPALEVHSRPFSFKLEKVKEGQERSVVYIAAESEREMEIWLKLLCKETNQPYPFGSYGHLESVPAGKFYRRSFSLQSTNTPEKPPRRSSLPPKHELKVTPRYRMPIRTDIAKLKSQSTSRLDGRRGLNSTSTSIPPSFSKSNISSITITSMKREDEDILHGVTPKIKTTNSKPVKHVSIYSPVPLPNNNPELSCSPFELILGGGQHFYEPEENNYYSPDQLQLHNNPTNSKMHQRPPPPTTTKGEAGPKTNGDGNIPKLDFNRNDNFDPNCYCSSCGRPRVSLLEASSQTDDYHFILIKGDHQSIV